MAIKNSWASGEVLTAADLTDTMKGVFINAQTASYTFGTADGFVTLSNASGGTATIPANSTAAFNTGAVIGVMNAGTAGSFTIGTAAGVTLNAVSGTTTLAPLESATLVKLATNTWQLAKGSGLPKATASASTGSPTITTVSGKTCYKFTGSGSITISTAGVVDALVVGGGGYSGASGTYYYGGGGGGVIYATQYYLPAGTYTVTVGAGGAGAARKTSDSVISNLTAVGGGNGTDGSNAALAYWAQSGGSGSGAATSSWTEGVTGQGNNGAASGNGSAGGGAGGAASGSTPGAGLANSITGSSVTYGTGGLGSTANTANTGNARGSTAGNGNSGVVILLFG